MTRITGRPIIRITLAILVLAAVALGCGRAASVDAPRALSAPGARAASGGSGTTPVIAEYRPGEVVWWPYNASESDAVENEYGMTATASLAGGTLCSIPDGQDALTFSQQLQSDSRVSWAEPNYVAETAESRGHSFAFDDGHDFQSGYVDQFAAQRLGLTSAHVASKGRGILVAVIDTGIDPEHPLLAGHLVTGHDFVDGDTDPRELPDGIDSDGDGEIDEALGHGSHVAGIVALVAPEAKIMALRVLDNDGRGDAFQIARAIDYAVARHANVINLSLGMLSEDHMLRDAITRARNAGAVVIASAGNWGAENPEEFPAASPLVSAVAATGADDLPTSFTSFGNYVALCAPGEGIRSAYWNGHTAVWSGTSMSAPFVSGGAALLLAAHPGWTGAQVLDRLALTATPLPSTLPEAGGNFGAGVLNLAAALAPDPPGDAETPDAPIEKAAPARP